jgi:hypothetical protein
VNHPVGSIYLLVLAVLIVTAAGVYILFARDLSLARARLAGHSETMQTSVGTLEYSVRGAGEPILAHLCAFVGSQLRIDLVFEFPFLLCDEATIPLRVDPCFRLPSRS